MEQAFAQVGREVQALAEDAALARKRLILRVEHGINCGTAPVAEDVNVVAFLRRLRVLEERLPALARNAAKLQQRRMAAAQQVMATLPATTGTLHALAQASGAGTAFPTDATTGATEAEALHTVLTAAWKATAAHDNALKEAAARATTLQVAPQPPTPRVQGAETAATTAGAQSVPTTPHAVARSTASRGTGTGAGAGAGAGVGAGAGASVAVKAPSAAPENGVCTQEEFEALPASVRGRVKLDHVVKVYSIIRSLLAPPQAAAAATTAARGKAKGKTRRRRPLPSDAPLVPESATIKELTAKGAKVTGITGDCALKSLRQLKLITMRRGSVSLVK